MHADDLNVSEGTSLVLICNIVAMSSAHELPYPYSFHGSRPSLHTAECGFRLVAKFASMYSKFKIDVLIFVLFSIFSTKLQNAESSVDSSITEL